MSDEDTSPGDKPHDPTPKKLEDARKKGEIVRSADLNTGVVYGGFLLSGTILAPWLVEALGQLTHMTLGRADVLAPMLLSQGGGNTAVGLLQSPLLASLALVFVPASLLMVSLVAQRAFLITPSKLAPKLNRLSPVGNAKQKYGHKGCSSSRNPPSSWRLSPSCSPSSSGHGQKQYWPRFMQHPVRCSSCWDASASTF